MVEDEETLCRAHTRASFCTRASEHLTVLGSALAVTPLKKTPLDTGIRYHKMLQKTSLDLLRALCCMRICSICRNVLLQRTVKERAVATLQTSGLVETALSVMLIL